jgi:hypothetical protein
VIKSICETLWLTVLGRVKILAAFVVATTVIAVETAVVVSWLTTVATITAFWARTAITTFWARTTLTLYISLWLRDKAAV